MTISGEPGDVSGATVDSWREKLSEIHENCVFWQALPDKGFRQRVKQCNGGKKSKQRLTVTFIVNSVGKSETKLIVIWRSENTRCFKGINKSKLHVEYFSQPKAWMTAKILNLRVLIDGEPSGATDA